jgi:hypothetical protein
MIELPDLVEEIARFLHSEGYRYSEAYPIMKWERKGWPTDPAFLKLVDGVLLILRNLDLYKPPQK